VLGEGEGGVKFDSEDAVSEGPMEGMGAGMELMVMN
jgi:hypothetical protein